MCYACQQPGSALLGGESVEEGPLGGAAGLETTQREGRAPPHPRISHLICRERGGRTKTRDPAAGPQRGGTLIFHVVGGGLNMASNRDYSGDNSGQLRFQDIRDSASVEQPNM